MRRLAPALLLALALTACSRRPGPLPEVTAELLSEVQMADPRGFVQLVQGFSPVEANAWRWAASKFSVVLRPPPGAREKGARLQLQFALPAAILERLGPVRLSAAVNGYALAAETYSQSGTQLYARDVPAEACRVDGVLVEFSTDKAVPPEGDDVRELAVVAQSVALVEPPVKPLVQTPIKPPANQ
jgi:hypothetical protein